MTITNPSLNLLGPVSLADRAAAGGSAPLRWLLESDAFAQSESKLAIALGEDCAGQTRVADLKSLPHLIVGGVPGSGKSTFLRTVITTLLFRCSPCDLRLFLFSSDPQPCSACEGIPHLLAPPTSDPEGAAAFLDWAQHEMERRYCVVGAAGVRNVEAFNRRPVLLPVSDRPKQHSDPHPSRIPYLVAVFDGLSGLAGHWQDGVLESAVELCQMGRAVGIHLLIAAEDLSAETLPMLLLVNLSARMSFRQASRMESSIVLGVRGAEELTEAGEALFLSPAARAPVSLRTPYLNDEGMRRVVATWRHQFAGPASTGGGA